MGTSFYSHWDYLYKVLWDAQVDTPQPHLSIPGLKSWASASFLCPKKSLCESVLSFPLFGVCGAQQGAECTLPLGYNEPWDRCSLSLGRRDSRVLRQAGLSPPIFSQAVWVSTPYVLLWHSWEKLHTSTHQVFKLSSLGNCLLKKLS